MEIPEAVGKTAGDEDTFKANLSRLGRVPVLMFHRVVEKVPEGPLQDIHFSRNRLDRMLAFIKDWGYETLFLGDLLRRTAPPKPLVLTFDDGYEDNYHYLFPLLKKHRVKAVIHLLGDRNVASNVWDAPKGAPHAPLLDESQILEMARSGLVEFGAHGMTHADLTALPQGEMEREIDGSKKSLEALLGGPVLSFAYPFGRFNKAVKDAVARAGFRFGIAVEWGPDEFKSDLMEIRRVCLSPTAGPAEFLWKTSPAYPTYRRLRGNPVAGRNRR